LFPQERGRPVFQSTLRSRTATKDGSLGEGRREPREKAAEGKEQRVERKKILYQVENTREPAHSWAGGEVSAGSARRGGDVSPRK